MTDRWNLLERKELLGNISLEAKTLKERQIEVAQYVVDNFSGIGHKGKKVVDVEETGEPIEVLIRFNDWTTTKFMGLLAARILAGKILE